MPDTQFKKAEAFVQLHAGPRPFVIPNPWDTGSARLLAAQGFCALATTSAGFAFSIGRRDGAVPRQAMIDHVRMIAAATDLPLSADLENCYADAPEEAAETLQLAAEAGAVGGSIEDYSGSRGQFYDFNHAVERIAAAVETIRKLDFPFVLTARAEGFFKGVPDLDDTIKRLQSFEKAGADVLYAPGMHEIDNIRAVCASVSRPVNVLAVPGLSLADLAAAGVKRISVGSALQRYAVAALLRAGEAMSQKGSFAWVSEATPFGEVSRFMTGAQGN